MYGKLFASTFTGSLYGAGPTVLAVWAYVIAHVEDGQVELHPRLLAGTIGTTVEAIDVAIGVLCAPDAMSRNPAEDGRRLLPLGAFAYRVVSHEIYRAMRTSEDRREYNRRKQRESRERRRSNRHVNEVKAVSHVSPSESEAEAEELKTPSSRSVARAREQRPRDGSNDPPTRIGETAEAVLAAVRGGR